MKKFIKYGLISTLGLVAISGAAWANHHKKHRDEKSEKSQSNSTYNSDNSATNPRGTGY